MAVLADVGVIAAYGAIEKVKETFEATKAMFDDAADSLRNKAEALAEQRKASEGKTETVAN